ncbi:MAG TPA: hypothetical protein VLK65_28660 [Vicinamibacteria bacterium]|nr:hypothetical protein [Vicinamibacteria bacterium]
MLVLLMACSPPDGSSSGPPVSQSAADDSGTPVELKSLIGERGSAGEMGLKEAGYEFRNGSNTDTSSITHWRGKNGACVEITTTDGKYASITTVDAARCADGTSAVAASGKPGAMRTVCGVIVDSKPHRYLCEVEENRQGTTVLRMPDTVLRLTWNLGSTSVEVAQEGAMPVVVKYADSEGETNFRVDERTFFYISNPSMAEMEVKNFRQ